MTRRAISSFSTTTPPPSPPLLLVIILIALECDFKHALSGFPFDLVTGNDEN